MTARVALVLREGGKHGYGVEHAFRMDMLLADFLPGVERVLIGAHGTYSLRFDWPGWWSKMELFRPDIEGDLFYLDLDTTPVADLTPLASAGTLTAIVDKRSGINSSCMYLPAQYRQRIWDRWMSYGPERAMRDFRGDQDFLYAQFPRRWRTFDPSQVVSFKRTVKPAGKVPEGALLVYYHGEPKPWSPGGELP